MKQVIAYLNFDGNCRQAMSFYNQCLGTELELSTFPDAQGIPSSDPAARIMHARLLRGTEAVLMASDTLPVHVFKPGNNFYVSIQCDTVEEIDRIFSALSQDGQVSMPLQDVFWGARFGMLTDQFGIQWMLNCELKQQA